MEQIRITAAETCVGCNLALRPSVSKTGEPCEMMNCHDLILQNMVRKYQYSKSMKIPSTRQLDRFSFQMFQ